MAIEKSPTSGSAVKSKHADQAELSLSLPLWLAADAVDAEIRIWTWQTLHGAKGSQTLSQTGVVSDRQKDE